jgi:CRP-like cAMP-binding protein
MYEAISGSLTALVDFNQEELFLFMQKLKPISLKKYDLYLKEGNVCKSMVIVNKGGLRYFSRGIKGDYTDGFAFEGEWLGDYESFLLQVPSAHYIEALEDSEIFALGFNDMQMLYEQSQRFERFGRIIAENLFIATAKSKRNLMLQSAEDRYMDLLTNQPHIFERLPQHLIASFLGIQPQSLSRIRAKISSSKLT